MLTSRPYHQMLVAVLSLIIAVTWTYATRQMYDYNMSFTSVSGVSLFPIVGWTLALFTGYFAVNAIIKHAGVRHIAIQFVIVGLFYAIAVVIAETVGYHVIGIQNIGTSAYAGLPVCDCLHAPAWMQIGYFALGPLHWVITKIVIASSNLWYFLTRSDRIV